MSAAIEEQRRKHMYMYKITGVLRQQGAEETTFMSKTPRGDAFIYFEDNTKFRSFGS